jgi:hypothetical protein
MLLKIFALDIIYVYSLTRHEDKNPLREKISYALVDKCMSSCAKCPLSNHNKDIRSRSFLVARSDRTWNSTI